MQLIAVQNQNESMSFENMSAPKKWGESRGRTGVITRKDAGLHAFRVGIGDNGVIPPLGNDEVVVHLLHKSYANP